MGKIVILLISIFALASCVTEKTFVDSKKQVRSLEFDKDDAAKTRLILGLSYLENGRFEQAKYNLEKAYEFTPDRADVNYSLGYYYQLVGEMSIAEEYYKEAVDLEPKNPDTLNNYGTFLCNIGDVEKAEVYFKRAINISKYTRAAESYENMAICALNNGQLVKAEEYYETSYKHNPSRANNVLSLAGIKYASGDLVAAIDFLGRYMRITEASARGLLLGYIVETRRGRISQANKYANQLQQAYPDSREALYFTTGQVGNSEFETLRKKYQATSSAGQPQIRITKKPQNKSATARTNKERLDTRYSSTGLIGAGVLVNAGSMTTNTELAEELKKKVEMFSKPLTDTEAIDLPQQTQSTAAIKKVAPLPTENVLLQEVKAGDLVNDRAATANQKQYLKVQKRQITPPIYTVEEGDNLYQLSVKFNVQMLKIVAWNQLQDENLEKGQTLYIADPNPYIEVDEEMLLSQLANQNNVKLSALMKWNQLPSDGWLKKGSKLFMSDPAEYLAKSQGIALTEDGDKILSVNTAQIELPRHKVGKNEFLYNISTKYNIKMDALKRWNKLTSESDLKAGQMLYLANPDVFYIVKNTQKLSAIATHLGVSTSNLLAWNNLTEDGIVEAGTKLLKVNAEQYKK